MKIDELDLSVRTYNCLKRGKIDTVEQLSQMSDDDLLRLRNFGQRCLAEVREKIALPRKTNADRIRAMSDKELAAVIMCPMEIGASVDLCKKNHGFTCVECSLRWLQEPAEEG